MVKGVEILNETKYNIPDFLSLLLTVVEIIFSPICLALGIQKEIGHTTKENVLAVGSLASISGKLIISSGGLEIVPDYITPAYWKTRRLVVWKYLKFLPFQILFLSIGCYFYYRAKKCKSALEKPTKVLNANQDFRCGKCGKNCMVMFEPCLDISLCKECAENCKVCPKCEKEVESQVEIHVA